MQLKVSAGESSVKGILSKRMGMLIAVSLNLIMTRGCLLKYGDRARVPS